MSEVLGGKSTPDQLVVTSDKTQVYGLKGNDTIISNNHKDVLLIGGSGNDSLIMQGGNGTLSGGKGSDVFELNYSASSTLSAVIEDFEPSSDKIIVNFNGNTAPQLSSKVSGNDVVLKDNDGLLNVTLKGVRENDYFDGTADDEVWDVLELTNAEREKENRSALTLSDGLTAGASIRAKEITELGVLGLLEDHTRRSDSPDDWRTVFNDINKHYSHYAENLDGGAESPAKVVDDWMNSESHSKNILNSTYKKLGIGYNYDDPDPTNHRWYWTQLFGESLISSEAQTVSTDKLLTATPEVHTVSNFISFNDTPNTYNNTAYGATIAALGGDDKITNSGLIVSVSGGAGNDIIENSGSFDTINGGAGNDKISFSSGSEGNLIEYRAGDGNDVIHGFALTDTLSISGGEYTTETIGNDIIVRVGTGSVTLLDAATLSTIIPYANVTNIVDLSPIKIAGTSTKLLIRTNGDDIYLSMIEGATIQALGGNDSIENYSSNVLIDGGTGDDSLNNMLFGSFVTINGGLGNDTINNEKAGFNVSINGGADNDSIISRGDNVAIDGGADNDNIFNWEGTDVTIKGGEGHDKILNNGVNVKIDSGNGNDDIVNTNFGSYIDNGEIKFNTIPGDGGSNVIIDSGAGNDAIGNEGVNVSINGSSGNDTIFNSGTNVTIDSGADSDAISNSVTAVSIGSGAGNDIVNNYGSSVMIDGDNDNDTIQNHASNVTIAGGNGGDSILNPDGNDSNSLSGGSGNDVIANGGKYVTINGGKGNDVILFTNNAKNNLIQYSEGDGRDIIWGLDETSTLKIGEGTSTYSRQQTSDGHLIIKVGTGSVTLWDAATLSAVNIEGVEHDPIEENNYISVTEHTYNNSREGVTITSVLIGGNSITNSGDNVSINDGSGNVTVNNSGSNVTIEALSNSTITNSGSNVSIYSGGDVDSISNTGDNVTINGGADKDTISSAGNNNKIEGGQGDDSITLSDGSQYNLVQYTPGDGDDTIQGFNETSTLSIAGGLYSTAVSGSDVVVTVGNNKITLLDATTLTININGISNEFSTEDKLTILNDKDNTYENSIEGATISGLGGNDNIKNIPIFKDISNPNSSYYVANVSLNGGEGSDTLSNGKGENATLAGGADNDYISNGGINSSINGGDGKDTIENSGASVTILGGADHDNISNRGSNTLIDGGKNNDEIYNSADGANVKIAGDEGNDIIHNYGDTVRIDAGADHDSISNSGSKVTIEAGEGNDSICNYGSNVSIKNVDGNDTILNGGDSVIISGSADNDSIDNHGSNVTISGGDGNDFISNDNFLGYGANVSINGDAGNDSITNSSSNVTILGGMGDDSIVNSGSNVTIDAGTGNDVISLSSDAKNVLIQYTPSGSNDTIWGLSANSSLKIGNGTSSYSTTVDHDDVIVTVGENTITLKDFREKPEDIIIGESGSAGGVSGGGDSGGNSSSGNNGGNNNSGNNNGGNNIGGNNGGNNNGGGNNSGGGNNNSGGNNNGNQSEGGVSSNEGRSNAASGGRSATGSSGRGTSSGISDSGGSNDGLRHNPTAQISSTTQQTSSNTFDDVLNSLHQNQQNQPSATVNQHVYAGGNQIISNYQSGEKIIFGEIYTGSFFDNTGNYCVGSSTGALVVQNAMDKVIDLSDYAGNAFVKAYAASTAGVIDGRGIAGFEIINGSAGTDIIYAGDGSSQLWGGNGDAGDILVGGNGSDIFIGGKTQGADIFLNASSTDLLHLNDATLSDIVATAEENGTIGIQFNTGNVVAVQSSEPMSAAIMLADGLAYRYNHATKSWQNA